MRPYTALKRMRLRRRGHVKARLQRSRYGKNKALEQPQSLDHFILMCESDTEYFDAMEHVNYGGSSELLDTIADTQITLNLFLNNQFELAEDRLAQLRNDKVTSVDQSLNERHAVDLTKHRKDHLAHKVPMWKPLDIKSELLSVEFLEELHAELCYAGCLLIRAVLAFFQDDNFASFIKGAWRIRSCYQIHSQSIGRQNADASPKQHTCVRWEERRPATDRHSPAGGGQWYCERLMLHENLWKGRDHRIREHFEAGVRMGLGTFYLMVSTLPPKVLRLLEIVGFSGDKVPLYTISS
ncbi:hypothetical protein KIN20_025510 [Parelaphostrongylus tenuis]|uniref:Uncharacterized protein n=1 Tax=Parelaphostrongylus tenuis TaxID=148309 RepID=A0AAD5QWP0_PARTN|nr:hypothetical protein KIN20_025510 [Parelaphostrongylus tenuis]